MGSCWMRVTLGIIFARIAHPKNRARTVFISDCAVVARRDGALRFMFRVADVRQTQVRPHRNLNVWTDSHGHALNLDSM